MELSFDAGFPSGLSLRVEFRGLPIMGCTMKRDITVWPSLAIIVLPLLIHAALGMPRDQDQTSPHFFLGLFCLSFIGIIRATILWFQTLAHGLKHSKEENRFALVMAHIFLGLLMAYIYYLANNATNQPLHKTGTQS